MRRPFRLLLPAMALPVLAALAVACSNGGDETTAAQDCPIDLERRTPISGVIPSVSLEEARQRVQFDLLLPEDLPEGVAVDSVLLYSNPNCPGDVPMAELHFGGPGFSFRLTESDSSIGIGTPTEPITINGVEGEMTTRDVPGYPRLKTVAWNQGGRGFMAAPLLNDTLTEELFLQILESIPE